MTVSYPKAAVSVRLRPSEYPENFAEDLRSHLAILGDENTLDRASALHWQARFEFDTLVFESITSKVDPSEYGTRLDMAMAKNQSARSVQMSTNLSHLDLFPGGQFVPIGNRILGLEGILEDHHAHFVHSNVDPDEENIRHSPLKNFEILSFVG